MRHREVSFECVDPSGETISFPKLSKARAELVQHEIDHLDGILMVDRLVRPGGIIAREMVKHARHPGLLELTEKSEPEK